MILPAAISKPVLIAMGRINSVELLYGGPGYRTLVAAGYCRMMVSNAALNAILLTIQIWPPAAHAAYFLLGSSASQPPDSGPEKEIPGPGTRTNGRQRSTWGRTSRPWDWVMRLSGYGERSVMFFDQ